MSAMPQTYGNGSKRRYPTTSGGVSSRKASERRKAPDALPLGVFTMCKPVAAIVGFALLAGAALAAPPKSDKNVRLTGEEWKGVSNSPLPAGEIDRLIAKEQAAAKVTPAPNTSDEQFCGG